jgi:LysM repeat protein
MIKTIILATSFWFPSPEQPLDSVRMETVNGQTFVIHRVDDGETLYGISRRYGTPINEILQYNNQADGGLEVGEELKVPYRVRPTASRAAGNIIHVVMPKETLYSISQAYQVTPEQLKQWNQLKDNSISVGQELVVKGSETPKVTPVVVDKGFHVVVAKETLFSISRDNGITVSQLKEWNGLTGSELQIGQALRIAPPATIGDSHVTTTVDTSINREGPPTKAENTIRISENVAGSDEIKENGLAELIAGTEGNRKYLALHRTAPVGTILKVKSELNNREVFVRVVGPLPPTGVNNGIVIKISKSAFDRLGAIDPRFRVEVTYYK